MHGKAISLINDIMPNLTGVDHRNALLRKAYSTTVIYGKDAGKSLMSTIRNIYPEDKNVCEFEHYVPWIIQHEDVVDTLEKKAPSVEKTSTNGYELWNYPNPFNPTTLITFSIPEDAQVRLSIIDHLGREAAVLVNEVKAAGTFSVMFNATNIPSGVYACRLIAGEKSIIKNITVLK